MLSRPVSVVRHRPGLPRAAKAWHTPTRYTRSQSALIAFERFVAVRALDQVDQLLAGAFLPLGRLLGGGEHRLGLLLPRFLVALRRLVLAQGDVQFHQFLLLVLVGLPLRDLL